jgi:hypothetical protein
MSEPQRESQEHVKAADHFAAEPLPQRELAAANVERPIGVNESMSNARTSRFARASHFWGVLALLLLLLAGICAWGPARRGDVPTRTEVILSLGAVICQVMVVVAAVAAIVQGILGLEHVRRGAGKVMGKGLAISGLVTATVAVLPLVLAYGVVLPVLARDAAKVQSSNNLKALAITMHEYHENFRRFPPAVLRDPALGDRGKPYSWRVALLPALGESELYSQYHRDQAWDSPDNQALLTRMPRVFAAPGKNPADGLTHYQVIVGPGTAFERTDFGLRLTEFPRGAAQTILIVEAADPVPWTKPQDLSWAPDGPLPKVGGLVGNGFHAAFANGEVRWFEAANQESELRTHVLR